MPDYGYVNARIRAMKSYLFDQPFFEGLVGMSDVADVMAELGRTEYRDDIEKGSVKFSGLLGVEEGLRINTVTAFRKILGMVWDNREAHRLVSVLLARWDLHNMRTILRGKHVGSSEEEILEQLIPAGEIDEATLAELAKQPDIKACSDLMRMWGIAYYRPVSEGYADYAESKDLANLELKLDKFYYSYALKQTGRGSMNSRLVCELMKREIDVVNILSLMRLVREDVEESKIPAYFIDGGRELTLEKLTEAAKLPEVEDVIRALKETSYYPILDEALKKFFTTGSISVIERRLEELVTRKSVSLFRADPLSIGLIIAYIWAKHNEMVNLRIILRGKAVGMTETHIREALVLV